MKWIFSVVCFLPLWLYAQKAEDLVAQAQMAPSSALAKQALDQAFELYLAENNELKASNLFALLPLGNPSPAELEDRQRNWLNRLKEPKARQRANWQIALLEGRKLVQGRQIPAAVEHFTKLLPQLPKDSLYAAAQLNRAGLLHFLGQIDSAAAALEDLQAYQNQLSRNQIEAQDHIATHVFAKRGQYDQALSLMERKLDYLQTQPYSAAQRKLAIFRWHIDYAIVLHDKGELSRMQSHILTALDMVDSTIQKTLRSELFYAYSMLGNYASTQQRFKEAEKYHLASLESATQYLGEKHLETMRAHSFLAECYMSQGQYEKALSYLGKAKNLFKEVYNNQLPYAVSNLQYYAECLIELNRLPEAEKIVQEAQILAQQTGDRFYVTASLWSTQGHLLRRQGKFEAAIQAYQRSIQANSTQWTATDLYTLPQAVIEQRDFLWENQLWLSLLGLAEAWEEYHAQSQDPRHLEQAYSVLEWHTRLIWQSKNELKDPSDQRQLLATARQVFERGIELAWKMHQQKNELKYLLQAFQWAESNKSIFLLQALRQQQAQDLLPKELLEEQRRLEQNIQQLNFQKREATQRQAQSQLNQALQEAQSDYARWLQKIQTDYPNYYAFHFGLQPQPLANIQQRLQAGELLLTYFVGEKETFLFALSPNKWTAHRLKPDWQQAKRLRQTLANPQLDSFPSQYPIDAHALYQNLVQPALAAHAVPKTLIIVPDGLLNDLPFEVFLTEATSKAQWSKLPYLLRQYNVRYQYAAQLYKRSGGGLSVNDGVLGMAASYADQPLERLPARRRFLRKGLQELKGAKDEVLNLQKTFGGGAYFLGEKATEAQFKDIAGEFDVLHLALHGLMNEDHPMASALAFTENGDTLEDNLLHAYEIMHLPLKAQLVVLSACETGYGKFDQGEGVMSLARSFFHAGAQSLVVSLWSVNDLTTQILMQNFYGHLRKGLAKDEALRQAKLDYLDQVGEDLAAHPGLWAAFITLGDPAPLVWERTERGGVWLLALGLLALVPLVWLVQRWV